MKRAKVIVIFGTRPEAIKLAPVIKELRRYLDEFETLVCVTAQHRRMLDQVLELFRITPEFDLNIMSENQDLFDITVKALEGLKSILKDQRPDLLLVQGDTTTTFAAALAAFYLKIPIGHIEAGLRTYDKYQPFPEEKNRHLTTALADLHFAPTEQAKQNLVKEYVEKERIYVTGNTSIDALLQVVEEQQTTNELGRLNQYFDEKWNINLEYDSKKLILVTGHRRENFGDGFRNICFALKEIATKNPDADIVYPVHLNPNVRKPVFQILGHNEDHTPGNGNIHLIEPLDYAPFVYLMSKSYLILTDSGGIQEEAPSLGKPVLVMRNTTERTEGITCGNSKLVGTDSNKIIVETQKLLDSKEVYNDMALRSNPYGDGKAAQRIIDIIKRARIAF
jgi:UDP-N-acetylglucosamine 2-epimerase (non-hydrolysing)